MAAQLLHSHHSQDLHYVPWAGSLSKFPRFEMCPSLWEDAFDVPHPESKGSGLTVCEDKKNLYIEALMPGLAIDEIGVTLEEGIIWIRGEHKQIEDKNIHYYRKAVTSYSYQLPLPRDVDDTKALQSIYQDGIVKLTFAKLKSFPE